MFILSVVYWFIVALLVNNNDGCTASVYVCVCLMKAVASLSDGPNVCTVFTLIKKPTNRSSAVALL